MCSNWPSSLCIKSRIIFLKPDPVRGSTRDPADPGLEPDWVEEKIDKEKTRCDPVDLAG